MLLPSSNIFETLLKLIYQKKTLKNKYYLQKVLAA